MPISALLYIAWRIVRQQGISKPISVCICTSVIAPVITAQPGAADDICSQDRRDVPYVSSSIVTSVIRIVEVIVVDEVVVWIIQVYAIIAIRVDSVTWERIATRRLQVDAILTIIRCVIARECVTVRIPQVDATEFTCVGVCGIAR